MGHITIICIIERVWPIFHWIGYAYKLFVTIVQLGLPFWQFADFGGGLHTVFAKLKSLEITPIVTADCL